MNWIQHPIVLEGKKVKLIPLDNSHFNEMVEVARQKEIWKHVSIDCSVPETMMLELKTNILKRASGEKYTFTVVDKLQNKIIGSTSLHNIFPQHRKVEIGWTWYDPAYWGSGYNTECKLLLLTYCFEVLKTVRVQLVTDENNLRSRGAIQKIGGKFEGVHRKERIKSDGNFRNTAMFSITDDEWEGVKDGLIKLIG